MVMGQLECLVENGVIKDYISHELAVSLMSGDEGTLSFLCIYNQNCPVNGRQSTALEISHFFLFATGYNIVIVFCE